AARRVERDPPGPSAVPAERHGVATDIDQCVRNSVPAQQLGGAVEGVTLRVAAEVELHRRIRARDLDAAYVEIVHAWMPGDEPRDVPGVRNGPAGLVAVKAPQAHEPADRGIEQVPRSRRQ